MDWDQYGNGRRQTIEIRDASSNALLDTRSVSNFANGQYLVWTLKGHVKINVINNNSNAVVSGIFFGISNLVTPQIVMPNDVNVVTPAPILSGIRVRPNPWRMRVNANDRIIFDNVPNGSTIKIFTVSGQHVKTLGSDFTWDVKNDSGDRVASGIYVYLIQTPDGSKKTGQIVIIK